MKIKTIENVWVVVDRNGDVYFETLTSLKERAMAIMSEITEDSVEYLEKAGFTAQKVNINFEVVE